ncbi:energy transducer TonB [Mucilaginibacter sp. OK283]|jgi:protein TonB|uniref:energy transducer TonB n=1 Tax=Mucilaginibacter sp. OK283 TaxID=1881049 RepID=UPI0008BF6FAC|nr:energy transducer TonB [Mucilaginibacter sp. OK283]SEO94289.1 protein TonB [Mucilaginibacter sp. OK283]
MSATKFNLYNAEWLDLVFDHRNKTYGAYELRQHYSRTMGKAMALTFAAITVWVVASVALRHKVDTIVVHEYPMPLPLPPPTTEKEHKILPPKSEDLPQPKTLSKTLRFPPPVVVPAEQTVDPHTVADLQKSTIASTDHSGEDVPENILETSGAKGGAGTANPITEDEKVRPFTEVEVLPQPDGGMAGWARFLQNNLRYPALARENNISGKVYISFIVEKDGQLSNITVSRGLGYGLDEESVRVLKLAKPWKPGIQNGHPVRVAYSIPFAFQLAEEN